MGFEDNPFPIHLIEVGGVFFFFHYAKQETHGTQSMGFEDDLPIHLFEVGGVFFYFKPW